jgi:hypothetical protein
MPAPNNPVTKAHEQDGCVKTANTYARHTPQSGQRGTALDHGIHALSTGPHQAQPLVAHFDAARLA